MIEKYKPGFDSTESLHELDSAVFLVGFTLFSSLTTIQRKVVYQYCDVSKDQHLRCPTKVFITHVFVISSNIMKLNTINEIQIDNIIIYNFFKECFIFR